MKIAILIIVIIVTLISTSVPAFLFAKYILLNSYVTQIGEIIVMLYAVLMAVIIGTITIKIAEYTHKKLNI